MRPWTRSTLILIRSLSTAGRGEQMNAGLLYLNPSLSASSRLFRELNADSKLLERFVVASSKLVTDLADRHVLRFRALVVAAVLETVVASAAAR